MTDNISMSTSLLQLYIQISVYPHSAHRYIPYSTSSSYKISCLYSSVSLRRIVFRHCLRLSKVHIILQAMRSERVVQRMYCSPRVSIRRFDCRPKYRPYAAHATLPTRLSIKSIRPINPGLYCTKTLLIFAPNKNRTSPLRPVGANTKKIKSFCERKGIAWWQNYCLIIGKKRCSWPDGYVPVAFSVSLSDFCRRGCELRHCRPLRYRLHF